MEPNQTPQFCSDVSLALHTLKELGVSNVAIVDDTKENLAAAGTLKEAMDRSGVMLSLFPGVDEFTEKFGATQRTGHSLVLTDFEMPCKQNYFGHENCGAIAVIDFCLQNEGPGRINFPIVISHGGQGHSGEIVELCFGNQHTQISDLPLGKVDPLLWERAIAEIALQLKEGEAKHLWNVRTRINESHPFSASALLDDDMKALYLPDHTISMWWNH